MISSVIRIFAPRTRWQFVWSFACWSVIYLAVFFSALALFGLHRLAPFGQLFMVGTLTFTPFLSITLGMLRYQINLQRDLKRFANTDNLTNLPNRRAFIEFAEEKLKRRDGILMMVDIDRFKPVNDTYGHAVGDICLREMALMMRATLSRGYYLARIGGEEFGILILDGTVENVATVAETITAGITVDVPGEDATLTITNSIGAVRGKANTNLMDLMREADQALYTAKANGRARLVWSDEVSQQRAARALLQRAS